MTKSKTLIKKINKILCNDVKSIKDITKQYDYEDKAPRGKGDKKKVACGQDGSYNELQNIYDKILKRHVDSGDITKEEALEALCLCCAELDTPRDRDEYYACLTEKLGIDIN